MSVSIIIPTLNEASCLAATLGRLRAAGPLEIIVADGGSRDATCALAAAADRLVRAPRGRAAQMNAGAAVARGDVLLFLHADCTVQADALPAAERCLARRGVAAGCYQMVVQAEGWMFRFLDYCATARVRLTGSIYGDQGLFVRRELFERIGGFPAVPFMEDPLICKKLRRHGRMMVLRQPIAVSPRRWHRVGIIRQTMRNGILILLAMAGVPPQRLAQFYPDVR
jgi:rSAM/selenodomain-associated transferase 2